MPFFMRGPEFFGGWWWLPFVVNVVFWGLLFGLIAWALLALGRSARPPGAATSPPSPSALEILQQRFARGEIDAATYDAMRQHLLGASSPQSPPTTV